MGQRSHWAIGIAQLVSPTMPGTLSQFGTMTFVQAAFETQEYIPSQHCCIFDPESSTLPNLTLLFHLPYNTYRISALSAQKLSHWNVRVFYQNGLYKAPAPLQRR